MKKSLLGGLAAAKKTGACIATHNAARITNINYVYKTGNDYFNSEVVAA